MSEVKIAAVSRTEFGKGAARRARRAGLVPAVLYGHGSDPIHISLPGHDILLALRVANALLSISVDGGPVQLALPKQVQKDPVKGSIDHVDLVMVKKGEKVTVEVRLLVVNDDRADRIIMMDQQTIALEVLATNIPTHVEIDVADLEIGQSIAAKDLVLPDGAVFPGEPDDLILSAAASPSQASLDAELAGTAGEAAEVEEAAEEA